MWKLKKGSYKMSIRIPWLITIKLKLNLEYKKPLLSFTDYQPLVKIRKEINDNECPKSNSI